jgi:outer membrane protein assembly factor BamE (lipoprotein component of BamABCDE complex)
VLVFLLGLTSPLWCCLLCAVAEYPLRPVAYLIHGRWPADGDLRRKLDEGMTEDEVLAAAGRPHRRDSKWNGTANWFYYHDSDGFDSAIVEFDERKRVRFAYKP